MNRKILIGAVLLLASAFLYGCGGGGGSGSSSVNESTVQRVLAKNILFRTSVANADAIKADSTYTNTTTQVMADNVVIDISGNALTSTNLQDALNNEMAVDLSKLLPGTTWAIINKTTDASYKNSIGEVTFLSDGTLTIDNQGKFAAAGVMNNTDMRIIGMSGCHTITPYSYELINNSTMYVSYTYNCGEWRYETSSVITIFVKDKNTLTMIGSGGYGSGGLAKISVLAKKE